MSVPVVVMKSFNHHGLGIARSLGRLGVDVYGIGISRMAAGLHSRYFRKKFVRDVDSGKPEEIVQYLLSIGARIGKRSLLIPTTDTSALLVADYAGDLREWYMFPNNSQALVHSLIDKKSMYLLAKKHGISTPRTYFYRSRADFEEHLKNATFPVMFKGIDGITAALRAGRKMFIARTKSELLDLYNRYEKPSNPLFMLQEYIPSDSASAWVYNGYFNKNSDCLFAATGKKIRQQPAYGGAASLGICLRNDTLLETTQNFIRNIGYKGIIDIDYQYDKRDDKYKILDVNPRCGSTFRLFVGSSGMDVVRAEYLDLTGQKVPENNAVEGRKWIVEDWDLVSSFCNYRNHNLSFKEWAKSFLDIHEAGWFSLDDFRPFFMMLTEFCTVTGGALLHNNRLSTFVYKQQKLVVFEETLIGEKQDAPVDLNIRVVTDGFSEIVEKFGIFSEAEAEDRLRNGHLCVVIDFAGEPASLLWVSFNEADIANVKKRFQVPAGAAYLYSVYTLPKYRNLGLSTKAHIQTVNYLRNSKGIKKVYTLISQKNLPAIRTSQKEDLRKIGVVTCTTLFGLEFYEFEGETEQNYTDLVQMFSPRKVDRVT